MRKSRPGSARHKALEHAAREARTVLGSENRANPTRQVRRVGEGTQPNGNQRVTRIAHEKLEVRPRRALFGPPSRPPGLPLTSSGTRVRLAIVATGFLTGFRGEVEALWGLFVDRFEAGGARQEALGSRRRPV